MIKILVDSRTYTRCFRCPNCGTEYIADYEEVDRITGYLQCPTCNASAEWVSGRRITTDKIANEDNIGCIYIQGRDHVCASCGKLVGDNKNE